MRQDIRDSLVIAEIYDETELAMPQIPSCYRTAASLHAFPIKPSFCAMQ